MQKQTASVPEVAFLGTFPPTNEGIATFNEDLVNSCQKIAGENINCRVIAINMTDTSPFYFDKRVEWEIDQDSLDAYIHVADDINNNSKVVSVVIQHEYGIFGGTWGKYLIEFLRLLKKPVITVMHTVTDKIEFKKKTFQEVTGDLIELSDRIVVLSKASQTYLRKKYPQYSPEKFVFIPHGIHAVEFINPKTAKKNLRLSKNTVLTTFGFLSRSKGIEYVIKALPKIIEKHPNVIYQILGQTHPVILKNEGEAYRTELVKLVKSLGIRKHVRFVDKYLDLSELLYYLKGTDIYVATSLNEDQTVSGTFSYALGTGRAVVATNFVQSKEMVTPGIGKLVPHRSPSAYAKAINKLLDEKNTLLKYHRLAYKKTRSMLWSNVAYKYINLIEDVSEIDVKKLALPPINLSYLTKMTNKHGILQFAKYDIPSVEYGYTSDDNSRALIATILLLERNYPSFRLKGLFKKYFNFIKNALREDGQFINYFDIDFKPTAQNEEENPLDHYGRILLSLSYIITAENIPQKIRNDARSIWVKAFNKAYVLKHTRPNALVLKSLCLLYEKNKSDDELKNIIINLSEILSSFYRNNSSRGWRWFEEKISYNNAILPESLALAYKITGNKNYLKIAKKTFNFLIKHTFMGDVFVPIGQRQWFRKGKKRSYYDQQPEDVVSTVVGLISMYEVTKEKIYIDLAKKAFSWFLGNNIKGIPIYNSKSGGVYDGLTENGVNKNQGAESLVSYLISRIMIEKYY